MNFQKKDIKIKTKKLFDIVDITGRVLSFVKKAKIKNGLINIQTMHTTAMLILNENEPLLLEDIKKNLEELASEKENYKHDDFDIRTVNMCNNECVNGHSHCKAIYLSPNVVLNLVKGVMQLGQWQRVLYIELDRAKKRTIQVTILGE